MFRFAQQEYSAHTVAWELARRGLYSPPSLWTVVDILKEIHQRGLRVRVACLDIDGKDNETFYPRGCGACSQEILAALRQYNNTNDITVFDGLACESCQSSHLFETREINETPLEERVANFIGSLTLDEHK